MTLYGTIVLGHVIAAAAGLGASFAIPSIMNTPRSAAQARFSLNSNQKIEKFAKVGSIVLLITGLVLGYINPSLFTTGWYLTSMVIYILVQFIVAGIIPKKVKMMTQIIEEHQGEDIPCSYQKINDQLLLII